jgi:acetyltransferase-like isoleucine patch superfamily enzyme
MNVVTDPGFYTAEELRCIGFRSLGTNVKIDRTTVMIQPGNISLGDNVRVDGFCSLLASGGLLEIGSYVHVGAYAYLNAGAGIILEDFCGLSQGTKVYSRTDDYSGQSLTNPTVPPRFNKIISGLVTFKKHSVVGSSSVVMPGVTVGEGASVGSLSLVVRSLDAWTVYMGSPVRKLWPRSRTILELERELKAELLAAQVEKP